MNAIEAIMSRRSTRQFLDAMPDEEMIRTIVEAGRAAPSGGNSQSSHFFVIRDPQVLDSLALTVQNAFARMEVTEGMYRSIASSIIRSKAGGYRFHYDAPVLIVIANQKDYGNNIADCACALENMMIAGNALNLGTCWINQLKWLNENPEILAVFRGYGLQENERIYGALAVGIPASPDHLPARTPLPRTGNEVTCIG